MGKKVIKCLELIAVYAVIFIICSVLFVLTMRIPCNLSFMNVLMYKGCVWIVFSGIVSAALMFIAKLLFKGLSIDTKDILLMFCGFCCVNMVLFTLIPVTVERSVSVFMLSYMEQSGGEFTQDDIKNAFNEKYVNEFGAFDKRFQEQLVSGNIEQTASGKYELTQGGKKTVDMFRAVSRLFNTDQRLVYPLGGKSS